MGEFSDIELAVEMERRIHTRICCHGGTPKGEIGIWCFLGIEGR